MAQHTNPITISPPPGYNPAPTKEEQDRKKQQAWYSQVIGPSAAENFSQYADQPIGPSSGLTAFGADPTKSMRAQYPRLTGAISGLAGIADAAKTPLGILTTAVVTLTSPASLLGFLVRSGLSLAGAKGLVDIQPQVKEAFARGDSETGTNLMVQAIGSAGMVAGAPQTTGLPGIPQLSSVPDIRSRIAESQPLFPVTSPNQEGWLDLNMYEGESHQPTGREQWVGPHRFVSEALPAGAKPSKTVLEVRGALQPGEIRGILGTLKVNGLDPMQALVVDLTNPKAPVRMSFTDFARKFDKYGETQHLTGVSPAPPPIPAMPEAAPLSKARVALPELDPEDPGVVVRTRSGARSYATPERQRAKLASGEYTIERAKPLKQESTYPAQAPIVAPETRSAPPVQPAAQPVAQQTSTTTEQLTNALHEIIRNVVAELLERTTPKIEAPQTRTTTSAPQLPTPEQPGPSVPSAKTPQRVLPSDIESIMDFSDPQGRNFLGWQPSVELNKSGVGPTHTRTGWWNTRTGETAKDLNEILAKVGPEAAAKEYERLQKLKEYRESQANAEPPSIDAKALVQEVLSKPQQPADLTAAEAGGAPKKGAKSYVGKTLQEKYAPQEPAAKAKAAPVPRTAEEVRKAVADAEAGKGPPVNVMVMGLGEAKNRRGVLISNVPDTRTGRPTSTYNFMPDNWSGDPFPVNIKDVVPRGVRTQEMNVPRFAQRTYDQGTEVLTKGRTKTIKGEQVEMPDGRIGTKIAEERGWNAGSKQRMEDLANQYELVMNELESEPKPDEARTEFLQERLKKIGKHIQWVQSVNNPSTVTVALQDGRWMRFFPDELKTVEEKPVTTTKPATGISEPTKAAQERAETGISKVKEVEKKVPVGKVRVTKTGEVEQPEKATVISRETPGGPATEISNANAISEEALAKASGIKPPEPKTQAEAIARLRQLKLDHEGAVKAVSIAKREGTDATQAKADVSRLAAEIQRMAKLAKKSALPTASPEKPVGDQQQVWEPKVAADTRSRVLATYQEALAKLEKQEAKLGFRLKEATELRSKISKLTQTPPKPTPPPK